jgi:hypothetical protein
MGTALAYQVGFSKSYFVSAGLRHSLPFGIACIAVKMFTGIVFELASEGSQPKKLTFYRDYATAPATMIVQCTRTCRAFQYSNQQRLINLY